MSNKKISSDRSFDGIADKFEKNIYGTTKGKLRHSLLSFQLNKYLPSHAASIIDVGGGTGEMTHSLALQGHHVLLNDISADVLSLAKHKLSAYPQVTFHHGDLQSLKQEADTADVVVCHAVLEWLKAPEAALDNLFALVKPNGLLSLSFFNRHAALFSNALYGNFDYINKGLAVRNQVKLNPSNPLDPNDVINWLEKRDSVEILMTAGIRCFHDYLRDRDHQQSKYDELLEIEKQYSELSPYKWLGRYFHIIVRKCA